MRGNLTLYRDQYGNSFWARTVEDLRSQIGMGGSRVFKQYTRKCDGSTAHTGYVIGGHWLSAFRAVEIPV